jgi:hypothetical protein
MPGAHRRHAQWTPSRITEWAGKTGPAAALLVAAITLDPDALARRLAQLKA